MAPVLIFLAGPAMAWNHTQWVWSRENLPLEWYMSEYEEDSLPEGYAAEVMDSSFTNWVEDAPCAQLSHSYLGVREGYNNGAQQDYYNIVSFDDPIEQNDTSALGVTYSNFTSELAFARDGLNYYYAYNSDIVFSRDIDWGTTEDIENGVCNGEQAIEGVATHEIGHLWGLAHSCEESDVNQGQCNDTDLLEATMFWQAGPACTLDQVYLNEDDVEGITALYGPYATFDAVGDTYGGVPLEVCFSLTSNSELSGASWYFGDGQTSEELEPCHTYTEKGQYTVNVTISGFSDDCGEWDYTERERAMVVACESPQAAEGFGGLFTFTRSADDDDEAAGTIVYQMVNQADTSVYGCIDQVQWDVFSGGTLVNSISAWSPKIAFPDEGDYEVVLNLSGPGGVTAESLTLTAASDTGCSAVPATAGFVGLLTGLLGAGVRRRRE